MPNFSTSLFETFIVDSSNSVDNFNTSCESATSPGPPLKCSSPKTSKTINNQKPKPNMKILNVNFQSVKNKKEELGNLIESTDPSIIIGTETWLNDRIHSSEIFTPSYDVYRNDRKDGYGGVLIAIKKDYISELISSNDDAESIFVKLSMGKDKPLIVGALYRPPNSNEEYMLKLTNAIEKINQQYKKAVLWLGGDLNLPDIDWTTATTEGNQVKLSINERFINMMQNCGLEQKVNFNTRKENILDLFLTNRPSLVTRCTPLPGLGDHDIVYIESEITPKRNKPAKRKIYLWKQANTAKMKEECKIFQEEFVQKYNTDSNVQDMWKNIKDVLQSLLDSHVPTKMTSSRYSQPWITGDLKRQTRRKKRRYNKARKSNKKKDWEKYHKLKKSTQAACKKAYNGYLNDVICTESNNNPKRFWSFIKSKKCESAGVVPLKDKNGITYSDAQTKANILNHQFSSVFNKDENADTIKQKETNPFPSMESIYISPEGVRKLLNGLQIHKATGPDEISTRLLKELADELTPVYTLLFQASVNQGIIPSDWKEANVVPIFKKGEKFKAENYRPVSLTSITCKVIEHIICSCVMKHLDRHGILTDA